MQEPSSTDHPSRNEESVPLRQGEMSTEDDHASHNFHAMEMELPAAARGTSEFRWQLDSWHPCRFCVKLLRGRIFPTFHPMLCRSVFMEQRKRARRATSICLNFAMVFERADEVILPAMYNFVAQSFQATPTQLATITLSRALVQALASPLGGLLGECFPIAKTCLQVHCYTLGSQRQAPQMMS